jgi:hypothetical protein
MPDIEEVAGWSLWTFLVLLVGGLLVFLGTAITMSARSSGSPDYCRIEPVIGAFRLVAHRPWSSDMPVGVFPTFAEAAAAADMVSCPFSAEKRP